MTTFSLCASHERTISTGALTRAGAVLSALFEILEDAHTIARTAYQRYPFTEW
jgi:hypothetical protein